MKGFTNKDQWLLDLIENFLSEADLDNNNIRKLASLKFEDRLATLTKLSEREKDNMIRFHEMNALA